MEDNQQDHVPVLLQELLAVIDLSKSDKVIDATFGRGGHARAVLDRLGPQGLLVGFERDPEVFSQIPREFLEDERVKLVNRSYRFMETELERLGIERVDKIYFDLGICSFHLENSGRGFSFQNKAEPFDCRFNPDESNLPAWKLVNENSTAWIKKVLRENGEVRRADAIAWALNRAQPVKTVGDICGAVEAAMPPPGRKGELARVFQAFRIEVNSELALLEDSLQSALNLLKPGGRLAVISFHSLEDRIVKRFFRDNALDCVCPPQLPVCACDKKAICRVVTQSPIVPEKEEIEVNSRARSAKMRCAEKIG